MRSAFQTLVAGAVLLLVVETFLVLGVVRPVVIDGDSMAPTLTPGRRLWVDRTRFALAPPRRWDMVVFQCPEDASQLCVKRVLGLPGEQIDFANGNLLVNGQIIQKSPSAPDYFTRPLDRWPEGGVSLAGGEFFVIGDNVAISADSRSWIHPGLPARLIVGVPIGAKIK